MRNKKDLVRTIVEMIAGGIALVRSVMLLMSDTSEYIGLQEFVLLLAAITAIGMINDSADTFRSELTGTPKRFSFIGFFDKELP